jgi:phosphate uptake regulator
MWKQLIKVWRPDSLLDEAWKESFEMLEIDRRMFLEATRILRESDDVDLNEDIRKLDKKVNKYERDVRRKVMTHCSVAGASELPSGMVLVSVVIDIERVGDYCKNILDLAYYHPRRLRVESCEERLADVEREVKERFDEAIEVMRTDDVEKARAMMRTYRTEVSSICDDIVNEMVRAESGIKPGDGAAMALYVRYLKRIGAHLNNTVSSVVNPFHRIVYKEKVPKSPDRP